MSSLVSHCLSLPLDSVHHVGGVLEGLSPNHGELEDYDYEEEEPAVVEESSYQLPLSEADKKMKDILDKLPMITTKKPKRYDDFLIRMHHIISLAAADCILTRITSLGPTSVT